MRWLALVVLIPGVAWGEAVTLEGTSDETAWVVLADGKGSLTISDPTYGGGTCTLQKLLDDASPHDIEGASFSVDEENVDQEITVGAGFSVRVACAGMTDGSVPVELWPTRTAVGGHWWYRNPDSGDYELVQD